MKCYSINALIFTEIKRLYNLIVNVIIIFLYFLIDFKKTLIDLTQI
jgi:hypothetical protein